MEYNILICVLILIGSVFLLLLLTALAHEIIRLVREIKELSKEEKEE
jgi:hypothetical protein